ncbi:MAG: penicillin-binding protein 1B [Acidiferrobacterales bacterium]|nr:penicillin-binding protein 1B [Acidiferrobacterales bacterium]
MTLLLLMLALAGYLVYLDHTVRQQFEGRRFALPARVYARPLELFVGKKLEPGQLVAELKMLRYSANDDPTRPGQYSYKGHTVSVHVHDFTFWDGAQPARRLSVNFSRGAITALTDFQTGRNIDLTRLDPVPIGGIYPAHNEDRVLVRLEQVPNSVVDALIAIEDHNFYNHWGIDPRGIARAFYTMVTGQRVQGGSTLTQQLVKNFYLTPERTITRKFNEILMALLLELHYDKRDILETYINEVYLGQDGNRAIHGFGLASRFYFNRSIEQLELHQSALLVGMLKGPTYFDPRRHPKRALERRNLVLAEMQRQGLITQMELDAVRYRGLDVSDNPGVGASAHPAFLELVHRQLRRDYFEDDLRSEGLQIFTTLDPIVQAAAEHSLSRRLDQIERARRLPADLLEGAVVVTSALNNEIHAIVGGRRPRFEGFNRALDAERQIGSLMKPAIYLTALSKPDRYTLVTPLDDSKLVWKEAGTDDWSPENYDKEFHGEVPLRMALANSYNVSSARLGLALGVDEVIETAHLLGVEREMPPFASTLLGTVNLTPLEVAQMYHTLATGGFHMRLGAIREVLTADGKPLQRYPLKVEQTIGAAPAYLITAALQDVVREGTARRLSQYLPPGINAAGKTGTTDELRDSWFAGYTGDRVAVVWVGNDENKNTRLTGSSGAMTVWGDMMAQLGPEPLVPPQPENVERVRIDVATGLRADEGCSDTVELPFIQGSAPEKTAPCASQSTGKKIRSWFQRVIGKD